MGWVKGTVIAAGVLTATAVPSLSNPANRLRPGCGGPSKPEAKVEAGFDEQEQRVTVVPQILESTGDRAQLGVGLSEVDEAAAKEHKLASPEGALVERVEPGSAAEKAGIKAGDVIVSFDGERVRSARQMQRLVNDTPPERAVKITVVRDGRKTDVTATLSKASGRLTWPGGEWRLGELEGDLANRLRDVPRAFSYEWHGDQSPGDVIPLPPRQPREPRNDPRSPFDRSWPGQPLFPFNGWTSGAGRLGVVVQEMTPQLGEYFGAKEGVLVASVTEGSPAAQAGVKAGDVITTVNGKAVKDADALLGAVRSQPDGQEMTIGIVRDRKAQTLKVKLLNSTRARPI